MMVKKFLFPFKNELCQTRLHRQVEVISAAKQTFVVDRTYVRTYARVQVRLASILVVATCCYLI